MCCCRHDAVNQESLFRQELARLETREPAIDPDGLRTLIATAVQAIVFERPDADALDDAARAALVPPGAEPTERDRYEAQALTAQVLTRVDQEHRAAASRPVQRSAARHA